MRDRVEIIIAQDGILVDWGGEVVNVYKGEPKEIAEMLGQLSKQLGGLFSGNFDREEIQIKTATRELWEDNQGI